MLQQQDYG